MEAILIYCDTSRLGKIFLNMFVCGYMLVQYAEKTEERTRASVTGVIDGCEPLYVSVSARNTACLICP